MTHAALTTSKEIRKPRRRAFNVRAQVSAYLFLLPALAVFTLVTWLPMLQTILFSFQTVNLAKPPVWIGFQNFARMFGNPVFYTTWKNTFEFIVLSLLIGFMIPVLLALMIHEMRRFKSFFRTLAYIPALIPIVVALQVWRSIYAPEGGFLNSVLKTVGLSQQLWLQDPSMVKISLIIIMTWIGAGGTILYYLASLSEIPTEIYEAAELDGFSPLQRIWFISLPLVSSRMMILLIMQIIAVSQTFTEPFILTQGGPGTSSMTPVLQIYNIAFLNSDIGLASAWSVSMLVVLALFSIVYVRLYSRRQDSGRS
jgi:multiple sugar transport system permease protein